MSGRQSIPSEIFYFHDPNAPTPNVALHPGVSAVIFDDHERILFMKRSHGDYWCLPGGRIDRDESAQQCCARETEEETGLKVEIERLISTNPDPGSVVHYPDGNIHRSFVLCFEARVVGGKLRESQESAGFVWLSPDELSGYRLIPDSKQNALDAWQRQIPCVIR